MEYELPMKGEANSTIEVNSEHQFVDVPQNLREGGDSFTFEVDDVKVCTKVPKLHNAEYIIKDLVKDLTQSDIHDDFIENFDGLFKSFEDMKVDRVKTQKIKHSNELRFEDHSHRNETKATYINSSLNGFLGAVHTAYDNHYHLQLSVSDFILLIGQGLGKHIQNNAEKLRKYFVNHEGKETLTVIRDEFVMGQQNDWSTVFGEFADQIKQRVKTDIYDVVIDDTSVATPTTRIVSELTLMDCMKDYFDYRMMTGCGIPTVTLKGTPEDWEKLRQKVQKLVKMNEGNCLDLDWWLKHLVPVIEKICDAGARKEVDKEFWKKIYKYETAYLAFYVTGWVRVFFPYLKTQERNNFNKPIEVKFLAKQTSDVPLTWVYYGKSIPMRLCGGFLGAKFDEESFTLEPAQFWSVIYKDDENK